jgi:uncharacterized DUF497 family protein
MLASLRMPMVGVGEGPAAGRGGAFGRSGDGQVGMVVVPIRQSEVISVIAARAAFSSTMALPAA